MTAYLRELVQPTCETCGRRATHQVYYEGNAPGGRYCRLHAEQALRRLQSQTEKHGVSAVAPDVSRGENR